ncbi:T9SS type A sorting domain-containing protein [Porphyromonas sp.]|uniref:T9SS type A sorting domain-containing protein n=1 Tax=Porphyromonas sp. TaxID=1924944 RepID=UPI00399287A6
MKKQYTLLLLLAMTLLGVATQTKAQAPLMEPSIDLTFITDDENASLLIGVVAPVDGCWIDLNGDGKCQDNEKIQKGTAKRAIDLPKDLTKTTIYGPITYLNLNRTALTSIDLSKINTLEELWCYQTGIMELDVTGQPNLKKLFCHSNMIKELDLSKNPKLRELGVQNCMLKSIDLSKLPELEEAVLSGNKISSIDLTHNPKLKLFLGEKMNLTSLDLSKCPEITFIQCSENYDLKTVDLSMLPELEVFKADLIGMESLDVSHNPKLKQLHLGGNKLTTLDLSKNPLLEELNLNLNKKLTSLDFLADLPELKMIAIKKINFDFDPDFSKNTKLEYINMANCGFKKLDLSHNPMIKKLYCERNELTELDLTKTPKLQDLIAFENKLTKLDFSSCKQLQYADISVNAIDEFAMQVIVESIPKFKLLDPTFLAAGRFIAIDIAEGDEKNDITDKQVKVATGKGWELMNGNVGDPQPYPGRSTVSVTELTTAETAIYYNAADQRLYVRLAETMPATLLKLYAASGEELLSEVYDQDDSSIYVGDLPQGAYIVQVGDTTYKFVKR